MNFKLRYGFPEPCPVRTVGVTGRTVRPFQHFAYVWNRLLPINCPWYTGGRLVHGGGLRPNRNVTVPHKDRANPRAPDVNSDLSGAVANPSLIYTADLIRWIPPIDVVDSCDVGQRDYRPPPSTPEVIYKSIPS